ncbi:MAG TPA: glycosyltransferase [Vicinamibacterales bacterium]|nr:glycosyltransferase [Vicinamibacterales bacterium]
MTLSLVIPAYNEAGRIGGTVTHVCGYLDRQAYDWELIVVIDGGPKDAGMEARTAAGSRPNVRVLENDMNRGKGYSVRRGFSEARGERLVFIDADLSLPVEGLEGMMARFDAGADIVIASRTAPGSRVEGAAPAGRDMMSRIFNLAVQTIALPGLTDTQCGFKGFTARAARVIFSATESDRFGFDVEALYLARKHGFQIVELPVVCRYHGGSSVSRLSDGVKMFADIVAVRLRHRK